jgi:carboxypeptidase Taq
MPLREWLRDNLHQYGRKFTPVEMLMRLTGSDIEVGPYVRYLYAKLRDIYQIDDPR